MAHGGVGVPRAAEVLGEVIQLTSRPWEQAVQAPGGGMLMKECSQVPAVLGTKGELGLQVVLGLSSRWDGLW